MASWGLADQFEYRGELDCAGKVALHSLDVLSISATYAEPKVFVPARGWPPG